MPLLDGKPGFAFFHCLFFQFGGAINYSLPGLSFCSTEIVWLNQCVKQPFMWFTSCLLYQFFGYMCFMKYLFQWLTILICFLEEQKYATDSCVFVELFKHMVWPLVLKQSDPPAKRKYWCVLIGVEFFHKSGGFPISESETKSQAITLFQRSYKFYPQVRGCPLHCSFLSTPIQLAPNLKLSTLQVSASGRQ